MHIYLCVEWVELKVQGAVDVYGDSAVHLDGAGAAVDGGGQEAARDVLLVGGADQVADEDERDPDLENLYVRSKKPSELFPDLLSQGDPLVRVEKQIVAAEEILDGAVGVGFPADIPQVH